MSGIQKSMNNSNGVKMDTNTHNNTSIESTQNVAKSLAVNQMEENPESKTICHVEQSETSNRESKQGVDSKINLNKDISPFLETYIIRRDFAHTCKDDNKQNLESSRQSLNPADHSKNKKSKFHKRYIQKLNAQRVAERLDSIVI